LVAWAAKIVRPILTRLNPAAFNPRLDDHESARREGLPPAAEVRAFYQADSRIVKG
jgi:hypothetical protein